jgi:hypothetical protein
MSDQPTPEGGAARPAPRCPWCSAALPSADVERCPSCGASLHEASQGELPGLTRVDLEAILRARTPTPRSRGVMGWLSGEYAAEEAKIDPGSVAPPAADVRAEMLRLEIAALEAEAQARQAEYEAELADARAAAGSGAPPATPPAAPPPGAPADASSAPSSADAASSADPDHPMDGDAAAG